MDTVQPENNGPQATTEPVVSPPDAISATSEPIKPAPRSAPKKLILGLVVVFVLLVLTAGGYYLMSNNLLTTNNSQLTTISPTVQPTIDPTADWATYTSKYGYSFKYPMSWGVKDSIGDNGAQIWSKPEYFQLLDQQRQGFNKEDYARIEVSEYLKGNNTAFGKVDEMTDLQAFAKKRHATSLIGIEEITLDGRPALLARVKREVFKDGIPAGTQNCPTAEPCTVESGETQFVWAKINGNILTINYWYGREYAEGENLESIFTNFLSTFKFADTNQAVDTSNWKTYTSVYEGASFRYPPNWQMIITKNPDINAEDVKLISPNGMELFYSPYVTGLGGGCDPDNCPLVKTLRVIPLQNTNSKLPLYLVEGTYSDVKRIGIMSTRDGSPVPKAGEYKGFPYYLLFESKDKGLGSFMLDQYDSKSRKYDGMSEQEFFNLPDIQTVRVILSSFKYN